jgi:hypothetical protein
VVDLVLRVRREDGRVQSRPFLDIDEVVGKSLVGQFVADELAGGAAEQASGRRLDVEMAEVLRDVDAFPARLELILVRAGDVAVDQWFRER